jgi:hypothetical protein
MQSVTVSESGYTGMFTPVMANGTFVTPGISSTQNSTFTFTGVAIGTTTVTISDTKGNSTTMQIVVK